MRAWQRLVGWAARPRRSRAGPHTAFASLSALRERIRQLDEDILRLLAARLETAKAIGRQKKLAGIPLRDWNMERQVLDRAAAQAQQLGLPGPTVRAIMQTLIAAARVEQERTSFSTYRGTAESILIIGGHGRMGRWFADFFSNQGHRVSVYDPAARSAEAGNGPAAVFSLAEGLSETSFALIAVPLPVVADVIDELTRLGYGGTICDIASLKSHLKPALQRARAAGLALTSIHPMFGPGARTLSDQVICVCDCGDAEATRRVEAFFADTAATLVRLSLDEHDRIISYVLGLSHLTNIVLAKVLMESGRTFDQLNRVGSTTFHSQMATTGTVIREDPELYYAIQRLNPFSTDLLSAFQRELATVADWIRNDDRAAFVAMMRAARRWMADDDAG